ncbi:MAG: cobalamin biosynthesis family protein [Aliiglaciecola sp.]
MFEDGLSWLTSSGFESLIIVTIIIAIERFMPWPVHYHPLTLFKLIATNLGRKVNPPKRRSPLQRRISGTLAIIVLLIPMLVIIAISMFIAKYPLFFDAFMLLIAIQYQPVIKQFQRVQKAIKQEQKILARQYLKQMVLRDTSTLSPMGIGKAAIESLSLRFLFQQFSIILWYLFGGGLAALTVRLLFELSQCWNIKLSSNREFGQPINSLCNIVFFIPKLLFALLFALIGGFFRAFKSLRNRPANLAFTQYIKLVIAGALQIQLGGPAIYGTNKVRYPKVGGTREVRFDDMQRTLLAINQTLMAQLVLIGLVSALFYAL